MFYELRILCKEKNLHNMQNLYFYLFDYFSKKNILEIDSFNSDKVLFYLILFNKPKNINVILQKIKRLAKYQYDMDISTVIYIPNEDTVEKFKNRGSKLTDYKYFYEFLNEMKDSQYYTYRPTYVELIKESCICS